MELVRYKSSESDVLLLTLTLRSMVKCNGYKGNLPNADTTLVSSVQVCFTASPLLGSGVDQILGNRLSVRLAVCMLIRMLLEDKSHGMYMQVDNMMI